MENNTDAVSTSMLNRSRLPMPSAKKPAASSRKQILSQLEPNPIDASLRASMPAMKSHSGGAPKMSTRGINRSSSRAALTAGKGLGGVMGGRVGKRTGLRKSMSTSALNNINQCNVGTKSHTRLAGKSTIGNGVQKPSANSMSARTKPAAKSVKSTISTTAGQKRPASSVLSCTTNTTSGGPAAGKKRAPWDLKGRLQDMESHMKSATTKIDLLSNQLEHTKTEKDSISTETSTQITTLRQQLIETQSELDHRSKLYNNLKRDHEDLEISERSFKNKCQGLEGDLDAKIQEVSTLKVTVASLTSAQEGIKAELETKNLLLNQTKSSLEEKIQSIQELQATVEKYEEEMELMRQKLRSHETERRVLHNTIQELKGNIRVFCRVRPLLGDEISGNNGTVQHMSFPDQQKHQKLEVEKVGEVNPNESIANCSKRENKFEFSFDRVFEPTNTQTDVFEEISQLVQSALDGYNVCIFAYGQTGSGKTYTMEGPSNITSDCEGMIPRSIKQIFCSSSELQEKGWKYTFEASFLEIYNESIRDLLAPPGTDKKHEIKMTSAKKGSDVMVTNLTTIQVDHYDQVPSLLSKASKNRAIAETKCNKRSSRSHSVFRLKITGENADTQEHCTGILNLIDLAGSERLKDSCSQGARLKETLNINTSLANLGNVIMALANKDSHIPYRNSKLTYLLQNCLGGQSKTLMFVNVSPREECLQETLNSLRFATKVNNCHIGTAQRKTQ